MVCDSVLTTMLTHDSQDAVSADMDADWTQTGVSRAVALATDAHISLKVSA